MPHPPFGRQRALGRLGKLQIGQEWRLATLAGISFSILLGISWFVVTHPRQALALHTYEVIEIPSSPEQPLPFRNHAREDRVIAEPASASVPAIAESRSASAPRAASVPQKQALKYPGKRGATADFIAEDTVVVHYYSFAPHPSETTAERQHYSDQD